MTASPSVHELLRGLAIDQLAEVGPREHIAVETLLKRSDLTVAELRVSIASVVARNRDEWQRVVERFDQSYGIDSDCDPQVPNDGVSAGPQPSVVVGIPAPQNALSQRLDRCKLIIRRAKHWAMNVPRIWLPPLLAALILTAVTMFVFSFRPPVSPDVVEPMATVTPATTNQSLLTLLEGPRMLVGSPQQWRPELPSASLLSLLAGMSFVFTALGLRLLLLPKVAARARFQEARSEEYRFQTALHTTERTVAKSGAVNRVEYYVEVSPAISYQAILDSAEHLGRVQREEPGSELAPLPTIRKTLGAGGQFSPVLAPTLRRSEVVVLVDVEDGDHPWLDGFRRILKSWTGQGVRLMIYEFQRTPAALRASVTRERIDFGSLARRTRGLSLIIFSRLLDPGGYLRQAPWLSQLPAWPIITWVDPDPRPHHEISNDRLDAIDNLNTHGVRRFALSSNGIRSMAQWLASEGERVLVADEWCPLTPPSETDPRIEEALRKWALAGCLVPDPTWDQLEAIRRHFFTEIGQILPYRQDIQRLIEWVARDTGNPAPDRLHNGASLDIPREAVDRWVRIERAKAQAHTDESTSQESFETRIHRLLMQQLEGTKGRSDYAERRRLMKLAIHRAQIEPDSALDHLGWIFEQDSSATDVATETLGWLNGELDRRDVGFGKQFPIGSRETFARLRKLPGGLTLGELIIGHWHLWLKVIAVCTILIGVLVAIGSQASDKLLKYFEQTSHAVNIRVPANWILNEDLQLQSPAAATAAIEFQVLPSGTFEMGSPPEEEGRFDNETAHIVTLTMPFAISKTEITQGEYKAVMGDGALDDNCLREVGLDDAFAVVCVSWMDAVRFANALSAQEGLVPAYAIDGQRVTLIANTGYRLPSEAEWEYSARGGTHTRYVGTDEDSAVCEYGNVAGPKVADLFGATIGRSPGDYFSCDDAYGGAQLAPVGNASGFKENAWRLSDLGGNAAEWVWDWYEPFGRGPLTDPQGPETGTLKIIRGASWYRLRRYSRIAYRFRIEPSVRRNFVGFRLARSCLPSATSVASCFQQSTAGSVTSNKP